MSPLRYSIAEDFYVCLVACVFMVNVCYHVINRSVDVGLRVHISGWLKLYRWIEGS